MRNALLALLFCIPPLHAAELTLTCLAAPAPGRPVPCSPILRPGR